MKTFTKIVLLTCSLATAICCVAQAQPAPERTDLPPEGLRPKRPQTERNNPPPRNMGPNLPMERILTDDQRDSMRQTMEAQREKMRSTAEKIRDTRKAMMTAAFVGDFNEDTVRAKALEVAKLEAELNVMRMKAISEVQPALSKEQIEQLLNPPTMGAPGNEREAREPGQRPNFRRNRPAGEPRDFEDGPRPPKRDDQ